ncbi:MAG: PAS domain S-box protein, partial [Planctomycetes bacterium]|nr:PAS domain S-box protein [Planctomycetota bacterium]
MAPRSAAAPSPAAAPAASPAAPRPAPSQVTAAIPTGASGDPLLISRSVLDACLRDGFSILTRFGQPGATPASHSVVAAGIKSVLCVPIEFGGRVLGALYVDSRAEQEIFQRGDLDLLAGYAAFLASLADRRILEGRVVETEHRLEYLLRHLPLGIFAIDAQQRITLWSPACERFLGRPAAEVVGSATLELLLRSRAAGDAALGQADAGADYVIEREFARQVGGSFLGLLTLRKFAGADGGAGGYVGLLEDVSERRALRDELAREEKMATLRLRVAGVAHDFKNVLSPMMGFADLAKRKPEAAQRLADTVLSSGKQGLALTTALLRQARGGEDATAATDVAPLLDSVLNLVHHELTRSGIEVRRAGERRREARETGGEAARRHGDPLRPDEALGGDDGHPSVHRPECDPDAGAHPLVARGLAVPGGRAAGVARQRQRQSRSGEQARPAEECCSQGPYVRSSASRGRSKSLRPGHAGADTGVRPYRKPWPNVGADPRV